MTNRQTSYDPGTDPAVRFILETLMRSRRPTRLFFGDVKTGRDWLEENDVAGTIGRRTGTRPVALLVPYGDNDGPAILTACILRILVDDGQEAYRHHLYKPPKLLLGKPPAKIGEIELVAEGYTHGVYQGKDNVANFKSEDDARRWLRFMRGQSMRL